VDLYEDWCTFLKKERDARLAVDRLMARTGFDKCEALFFLIEAWLEESVEYEPGRSWMLGN
jgi:hypothetical protein